MGRKSKKATRTQKQASTSPQIEPIDVTEAPEAQETASDEVAEEPAADLPAEESMPDEILWQPYCEVLDEPVDEVAPATPEETPADFLTESEPELLPEPPTEQPAPESTEVETSAAESLAPEATTPETPPEASAPPAKRKNAKKESGPKKLSCLDAAAQVLGQAGKPLTCPEMIEEMSKQGLWSSPNGATPAATLYSAILRELKKGADSRFQKTERGKFISKA